MSSRPNRRKKERYEAKLFLELFDPSNGRSQGRGIVVDFSMSGLAVETEAELEVGKVLECHIEAPIRIQAKVVRRIIPGQVKQYGLQISGTSFLDKLVLKKIMKGGLRSRKI